MKKLLVILFVMTLCAGCNSNGISKTQRENEQFLKRVEITDSELKEQATASSERKDLVNGIYLIVDYDSSGRIIGRTFYTSDGTVIQSAKIYFFDSTHFKSVTRYNRAILDNPDAYGIPKDRDIGIDLNDSAEFILIAEIQEGEGPVVNKPYYFEHVMPDGSRESNLLLVNEKGEHYLHKYEQYDRSNNLIDVVEENPERTESKSTEYENGNIARETVTINNEDGSVLSDDAVYKNGVIAHRMIRLKKNNLTLRQEAEAYENGVLRQKNVTEYYEDYRMLTQYNYEDGKQTDSRYWKYDNSGNLLEQGQE